MLIQTRGLGSTIQRRSSACSEYTPCPGKVKADHSEVVTERGRLGVESPGVVDSDSRTGYGHSPVVVNNGPSDVESVSLAGACEQLLVAKEVDEAVGQGLTLVHFSAQLERFVSDRGCA